MDAYKQVTENILEQLKNGVVPWHKPFATINGAMNYVSRKPYSLLNTLLLTKGGEWLTPKQAMELGGDFRGAKTETVCFFKMVEKKSKKESEDDDKTVIRDTYPILKFYRVLHVSDVKGVESKLEKAAKIGEGNIRIDEIDSVINGYLERENIALEQTPYSRACYAPGRDIIAMPPMDQFSGSEAYYATLFHEMAHSTGTKGRLARDIDGRYGSEKYSREELVAEMASAMLCSRFEIDTADVFDNSVAYVKNWMDALAADDHMIVWAAGRAEKAVRMILGENAEEASVAA